MTHEWRSSPAHRMRLAAALEDLRRLPCAGGIIVFGSMGRGDPLPGDVDLVLDVTGSMLPYEVLAVARHHYGLVDPFVRIREPTRLLVRDAEAAGWIRARNVRSIRQGIERDGRPLAEVRFEP